MTPSMRTKTLAWFAISAAFLAASCSAQVLNMRSFTSRITYDGTTQEREFVEQCNLQIEEIIDYEVVSGTVESIYRAVPVTNYMWALNEIQAETASGSALTTLRTGMSGEFDGVFVHQHSVPELTIGDNYTVVYKYSPRGALGTGDGRTLFEGTEVDETASFALGLFDRSSGETETAIQSVSDISVTSVIKSSTADYFASMVPIPAAGPEPLSVVKTDSETEVTITHPGLSISEVPANAPLLYQFYTETSAAEQCGRLSSIMVAAIWFSVGLSVALCFCGTLYVRRKDAENWGRHVAEQRALEKKKAAAAGGGGDGGASSGAPPGGSRGSRGSKRGRPGGRGGSTGSKGSRGTVMSTASSTLTRVHEDY